MNNLKQHNWLTKFRNLFSSTAPLTTKESLYEKRSLLEQAEKQHLNDEPGPFDLLGRGTQLLAVINTIANADPPLVIGIHGDWGTGKTSFMRAMQCLLSRDERTYYGMLEKKILPDAAGQWIADRARTYLERPRKTEIPTVWFNPWEYQFEEEPILPLLDTIRHQLRPGWKGFESRLKTVIEDPRLRIIAKSALTVAKLVGPGWFTALSQEFEDDARTVIDSMSQFQDDFEQCMRLLTENMGTDRLVIFVDDMDRCEAEYVVKILEALKLNLLNKHCIFVLGCSKQRVTDSLVSKLELRTPGDAEEYIEKIIQVPVYLPPVWQQNFKDFLRHLKQDQFVPETLISLDGDAKHQSFDLLMALAESNPRRLKRFLVWYDLENSMIDAVTSPDGQKTLRSVASTFIKNESLLLKIKLLQYLRPWQYRTTEHFLQDQSSSEGTSPPGLIEERKIESNLPWKDGKTKLPTPSARAATSQEKRYHHVLALSPHIHDEIRRLAGQDDEKYRRLLNELTCLIQLTTEIEVAKHIDETKASEAREGLIAKSPDIIDHKIREALQKKRGELTQHDYELIRSLDFADNPIAALDGLERLTNILTLGLRGSRLTALPEWIGQLELLQRLELSGNQLSTLPESIGQLKRLRALELGHNQLSTLPESISQLAQLEGLYLPGNQLSTLPESIGQLRLLQRLDLGENLVTTLPESITALTQLRGLYLGANKLSTLPESIGQLTLLEDLDLNSTGLRSFPVSITQLKQLQHLALGANRFTSLPYSIAQLAQLQYLQLSRNRLSTLPESIGQLRQLQQLYLNHNQLSTLPESIGQLKQLQVLGLIDNQLSTLPESIGQLAQLARLYLNANQLLTLPESIGQLKQLQQLHLGDNQLSTLPESIAQLKQLQKLDLRGNRIEIEEIERLRLLIPSCTITI